MPELQVIERAQRPESDHSARRVAAGTRKHQHTLLLGSEAVRANPVRDVALLLRQPTLQRAVRDQPKRERTFSDPQRILSNQHGDEC